MRRCRCGCHGSAQPTNGTKSNACKGTRHMSCDTRGIFKWHTDRSSPKSDALLANLIQRHKNSAKLGRRRDSSFTDKRPPFWIATSRWRPVTPITDWATSTTCFIDCVCDVTPPRSIYRVLSKYRYGNVFVYPRLFDIVIPLCEYSPFIRQLYYQMNIWIKRKNSSWKSCCS